MLLTIAQAVMYAVIFIPNADALSSIMLFTVGVK